MAVKVVLKKDAKTSLDTLPVYIRITEDRQSSYISLGFSVKPELWSDKYQLVNENHPDAVQVNEKIYNAVVEIERIKKEISEKGGKISSRLVKRMYNKEQSYNFVEFADNFIKELRNTANYGTYINYRSSVKKLIAFIDADHLDMENLDTRFLAAYQHYLTHDLKNSTNTIYNNMKVLRKIIYNAIDAGLISHDENPFKHYKLEKVDKKKDFLNKEELFKVDGLIYGRNNPLEVTRSMFLFSCFTGLKLNVVKSLKWKDIKDRTITFKHLGEDYEMKLINKAISVLNNFKSRTLTQEDPDEIIFPSYSNVYINKNLKRIAKDASILRNLTFNMARNTFGVLAIKNGIGLDVVAKLMGHKSFYSILPYAKSTSKDVDYAYQVLNNEFF